MNYLTIIFFEKLASRVKENSRLIHKLREEILADANHRLQKQRLSTTLYLSSAGKSFQSRMSRWFDAVEGLERFSQAELIFRRLIKLEAESQELHDETQRMLSSPGRLDTEKLHFVFLEEQDEIATRLREAIRLDMYRLVASGGGKAFLRLPPLKYVHPQVDQYFQYYDQVILPALALVDHRKRYGIWAYQYREQARLGSIARLPAYVEVEPRPGKHMLLLGENQLTGTGSNMIWQGVGVFTNITPDTVQSAQEQGIHTAISTAQLIGARLQDSPVQILDQCFNGEWYAIDPSHFYAQLTMVLYSKTISNRAALKQCLYCGADGAEGLLCLSCISKVRQKI